MGALFIIPIYGAGFVLALYWTCRPSMALKSFLLRMFAPAFSPIVLVTLIAVVIGIFVYDGQCYGFTDGQWECGIGEFLGIQLQYAVLFEIFFSIVWIGVLVLLVCGNVGYRYLKRAS